MHLKVQSALALWATLFAWEAGARSPRISRRQAGSEEPNQDPTCEYQGLTTVRVCFQDTKYCNGVICCTPPKRKLKAIQVFSRLILPYQIV